MGYVLGLCGVLIGVSVILGGLALLARRIRRTGVGIGLLGVYDEVYRPTAAQTRTETVVQHEAPGPGAPADHPPVFHGPVGSSGADGRHTGSARNEGWAQPFPRTRWRP